MISVYGNSSKISIHLTPNRIKGVGELTFIVFNHRSQKREIGVTVLDQLKYICLPLVVECNYYTSIENKTQYIELTLLFESPLFY